MSEISLVKWDATERESRPRVTWSLRWLLNKISEQ